MFDHDPARFCLLHDALDQLSQMGQNFVSCPFFTDDEIAQMIAQTSDLEFRTATAVVGNNVHQDMSVCFPAPRQGVFDACATLLETAVAQWPLKTRFIAAPFTLNDFAVQKYPKNSKGIGIHKDGLRYQYLVFIITLSGQSRLFYTDKREGGERIAIDDTPGKLVILKAPEFTGFQSENRLLHGVDKIKDGRLSIGFRYEKVKS